MSAAAHPLYGSIGCRAAYASGKACRNKAYYIEKGCNYLCGTHTDSRIKMPKIPAAQKRAEALAAAATRAMYVASAREVNAANGCRGIVILFRKRLMKPIVYRNGFEAVFPNNRDGNRHDGLGLASLSPMQLGPVVHGQPHGLPDALNLENFHQMSKQLEGESDEAFLAAQIAGFLDPVPHRHKVKGAKMVGWIYVDPVTWKQHTLDRVTARQFYCNWYERLAMKTAVWKRLDALVAGGTSVQICGPDGYSMDDVEAAYLDKDRTFGHEACLYTMLTNPDPASWPWRKHKTFVF